MKILARDLVALPNSMLTLARLTAEARVPEEDRSS